MQAEVVRLEQVQGLAAVASEHRAWLVRRLALVVGDVTEAEDLAQQTLLRATEHWPLPDGSDVRAWLAVVGVHLAIDERRRRKRWGFLPIRETDQEWAMVTDPDLWRALADLDRRTRAALVLTVLDGYTQDEVAQMLSVPRGTVASWVSRGKARLRRPREERNVMDELDRRLRRRLEALAEAVPMSAEPVRLARLSKPATRSRASGFSTLAAGVGVIVVVGLAIAIGGRGGPPAAASPAQAVTASPAGSDTGAATTSPSPGVTSTPQPSAAMTRPPADVTLPYPDGCPAYGLSPRRCAYIVNWALAQAGASAEEATVQLLGDPECAGKPADCMIIRTMTFIVRVRVTPAGGEPTDHPVFCGVGGDTSMLCTDTPVIRVTSPMSGYHDVPCGSVPGGEPGSHCATPMPTIAAPAQASAVPLRVPSLTIAIDHAGGYALDLGQAILPNGILTEASATLADATRSDVLVPDGIHLEVIGEDGKPLVNAYDHGWRAGTELVQVRLVFSVESFEPGTTLTLTDVVVR